MLNTYDRFNSNIVALSFSNVDPMTCFALSAEGELVAATTGTSFTTKFTQHRFDAVDKEEREIEELVYSRGMMPGLIVSGQYFVFVF